MIGGSAAKDCGARVRITILIGPLRDIADQVQERQKRLHPLDSRPHSPAAASQVQHPQAAGRPHSNRCPTDMAVCRRTGLHTATPIHGEAVCRSTPYRRGRPRSIPRSQACCPSLADTTALPPAQEIVVVLRPVAGCLEKFLELRIRDRRPIQVERAHMQHVTVQRRASPSQGYCTSTPGSLPPSTSMPLTSKSKSPSGMRTIPGGAVAAALVSGISTSV